MHKLLKLTGLIIALTLSVEAFAQKVQVSGKVVDAAGIPLIAVTVYEEGNPQTGTVTDFDGEFTLTVTGDAILEVSYVGFKSQIVNAQNDMTITLLKKGEKPKVK